MISLHLDFKSPPQQVIPQKAELHPQVAEQIRMLLRGLALHARLGEQPDRFAYQDQLNDAANLLNGASTPEDLQRVVAKALQVVAEYEKKCSEKVSEESGELRRMLQAMTETLIFMSGSSDTSIKQLAAIEQRLARATSRHATGELKATLDQCLVLLRQEGERLQTQSREKIAALTAEVEILRKCLTVSRVAQPADPVTSLPGRASAEAAIRALTRSGKRFLTALFCVEQLVVINVEFGRETGDEVLLAATRRIANELSDVTLYRWSGPAILAIFDPKADGMAAEGQAKKLAELRTDTTVQTQTGRPLPPTNCSLRLQQFSPDLSIDSIFHTFDTFIATPMKAS